MFDHHQAEITVIQFTGHSLPMRQSMRVSWDFYLVPFHQPSPPTRSLSITCHWNVSLPSGASLCNGMLTRVEGQNTTRPYSSIDTTAAWKKLTFILLVRSDFHMIDSLLMAVHAFVNRVPMSFSVDEPLLPR